MDPASAWMTSERSTATLWLPRLERALGALAPELDQFRRAIELVNRAGVARDLDHEVGTIRGKPEAGEVFLHQIQRLGERIDPARLGDPVVMVADGALDERGDAAAQSGACRLLHRRARGQCFRCTVDVDRDG